jgi:hypothetical protein
MRAVGLVCFVSLPALRAASTTAIPELTDATCSTELPARLCPFQYRHIAAGQPRSG